MILTRGMCSLAVRALHFLGKRLSPFMCVMDTQGVMWNPSQPELYWQLPRTYLTEWGDNDVELEKPVWCALLSKTLQSLREAHTVLYVDDSPEYLDEEHDLFTETQHTITFGLPREGSGLSMMYKDALSPLAANARAIVFDLDCTISNRHMYKTMIAMEDSYVHAFLEWKKRTAQAQKRLRLPQAHAPRKHVAREER